MTDMEIPDVAAPLVGYKILVLRNDPNIRPDARRLRSEHDNGIWDISGRSAYCDASQQAPCPPGNVRPWDTINIADPTPRTYHYAFPCGIYAFKDLEPAVRLLSPAQDRMSGLLGEIPVLVRVLLWGKVWEYEKGYRAEHARIDGIGYAVLDDPLADQATIYPEPAVALARIYDVPLVNMTDLVRARIEREREISRLLGDKIRRETLSILYRGTATPHSYAANVRAQAAALDREIKHQTKLMLVRLGVAAFVLAVSMAVLTAHAH